MSKLKRKILLALGCILITLVLLVLTYVHKREQFVRQVNAMFDPEMKAFQGLYIPWPLGRPTLVGQLNPKTNGRIRDSGRYKDGGITTNGMKLIIFASDGHYIVERR